MEALVDGVMALLLAGDDPVLAILRRQYEVAKPNQIKYTGVGFFRNFILPERAPTVSQAPSFSLSDVVADISGLVYGAGFILFVTNGTISTLEDFTYDEEWPNEIGIFVLNYIKGGERDFVSLRESAGWPK